MITAAIFVALTLIVGCLFLVRYPTYLGATVLSVVLVAEILGCISSLGNPVPLTVAHYRVPDKPTIAGYVLDEGRAIYLLIVGDPPQLIQIPWSEQQAAQLHEAGEAAKAAHTALKANLAQGKKGSGTQSTQDSEKPMFYAEPQKALPDKQGE